MPTNPHPSLPEAWQQAERQLDAGFPDAAAQLYRQLLDDPQLAPAAHLRLSLIASDRGRYREAVEEAMSSFRTRRPEPELLQALARRLGQLGETRAMATSVRDQNRDTATTARRPSRKDGRPSTPTSRVKRVVNIEVSCRLCKTRKL